MKRCQNLGSIVERTRMNNSFFRNRNEASDKTENNKLNIVKSVFQRKIISTPQNNNNKMQSRS